ncbi:PLP-dependent aminotransferase family protein [Bradyrhizobium sp. 169]|uniref:aminotransferase-like domain-containing protein n=1 Tax=Bradyrhizobium sp. 169 TaxID=2782640 RepID=UPI001FFB622C|nr:PLP-dependent aminotransferase family protein [Bradyrhizobium sp. 169]MCK1592102.1 PLP-dependent aminotransferase family protein [Bradyrhizobium sp. 169]
MRYRYDSVVDFIHKRIEAGTLKVGDRLPSIRQLSLLTGFSTVTIHHAYELLESQGYCTARPRSGFYLSRTSAQLGDFPRDGENSIEPISIVDFPQALLLSWQKRTLDTFGAPHPSVDLFDCTELDRTLRRILRSGKLPATGASGDAELRLQIAKRAAQRGIFTRYQDIVVTGSAIQGFNLSLDALTDPGDVVLVESPSYFPALSSIKHRNLQVVEIYSHPKTGVDPDQFEYLIKNNQIRVALLMANNHFPTGITYSEEGMKRIVAAARKNNVTIVENDMLGELYYGKSNRPSLKQFDSSDTVLQFSSFECSLAPEYGLGWVIGGKHARRILAASYLGGYTTNDCRVQEAVADYLSSHSQDRNLRRIRHTLALRMERGLQLLADSLPGGCSVGRPTGGYMCWIRAPQGFKSSSAVPALHRQDVSLLPGPVFSAAAQSFENFFALNLSFPWTTANEARIARIAKSIAENAMG